MPAIPKKISMSMLRAIFYSIIKSCFNFDDRNEQKHVCGKKKIEQKSVRLCEQLKSKKIFRTYFMIKTMNEFIGGFM